MSNRLIFFIKTSHVRKQAINKQQADSMSTVDQSYIKNFFLSVTDQAQMNLKHQLNTR